MEVNIKRVQGRLNDILLKTYCDYLLDIGLKVELSSNELHQMHPSIDVKRKKLLVNTNGSFNPHQFENQLQNKPYVFSQIVHCTDGVLQTHEGFERMVQAIYPDLKSDVMYSKKQMGNRLYIANNGRFDIYGVTTQWKVHPIKMNCSKEDIENYLTSSFGFFHRLHEREYAPNNIFKIIKRYNHIVRNLGFPEFQMFMEDEGVVFKKELPLPTEDDDYYSFEDEQKTYMAYFAIIKKNFTIVNSHPMIQRYKLLEQVMA